MNGLKYDLNGVLYFTVSIGKFLSFGFKIIENFRVIIFNRFIKFIKGNRLVDFVFVQYFIEK